MSGKIGKIKMKSSGLELRVIENKRTHFHDFTCSEFFGACEVMKTDLYRKIWGYDEL